MPDARLWQNRHADNNKIKNHSNSHVPDAMSFFQELRRRNVFRMGIAYVLGAWVLLQIIDFVLELIVAPDWILQVFFLAAAVGLPVVLIVAWVFEMTPEGVKLESQIDRGQSITTHTGRKLDRVVIVFLALAVVLLLLDKFMDRGGLSPIGAPISPPEAIVDNAPLETAEPVDSLVQNKRSVAVLPFVNMSPDPDQEYFSDGISEELLNVLVRVEGLRVPSRTSSFTFKDSNMKVADIGRELNVDHVLEGSVRKSGNKIRVTAQLIDVHTDTHLWTETYTRELDDIFAVQDEIARAIVGALKITMSGADQQSMSSRSTSNTEAYNKYLLGRHLWNQRTAASLLASVKPLQEAVQIDPAFDQAWSALADAYALIPEYRAGAIEEYVPLGLEAAEQALALNPDSARALTARAYIKSLFEFDMTGATSDYEKAIELEPDYATAHQWYGEFLAVQRRTDEALEQLQLAAEADPLSAVIAHVKGWILMYAGRLEEALEQYDVAMQLDPHMPPIINNLMHINLMLGNYEEARTLVKEYDTLVDLDMRPLLIVIDALENPALKDQALETLAAWELQDGVMAKSLYLMMLGEHELTLDNLEQAFERGDPYAIHMNRIIIYDPLRDNPRFQAMLQQMNLWP